MPPTFHIPQYLGQKIKLFKLPLNLCGVFLMIATTVSNPNLNGTETLKNIWQWNWNNGCSCIPRQWRWQGRPWPWVPHNGPGEHQHPLSTSVGKLSKLTQHSKIRWWNLGCVVVPKMTAHLVLLICSYGFDQKTIVEMNGIVTNNWIVVWTHF